ncbi:MAG: SGNH/GDSL hydrolase family protein [Gammaproteobacteria bacterium]|nr:SGNH/GDSL hydrolase family protein [Gammaproteobacteria bacterium]MCW5582762.1 SGNH/GDSL hydrolase family protein [Gammaproteobacteria bacterium]
MNVRPNISHFIVIGDSLSDRGTMYKRKLFGFIPMRSLSGLKGRSPADSFTNGYPWVNHLIAFLANEFTIKKIKDEMHLDTADISDAVISQDLKTKAILNDYYHLKDDLGVDFNNVNFMRNYAEGGLTSHDYSWRFSINLKRFFARLILSTLEKKRNELLHYDQKHQLSEKQKLKTLIVEWSGANDLITVNKRPSRLEVENALFDRINNIKQLIKNGYRHFILFNLPDLSLTPRYQTKHSNERENAHQWSAYFNKQLSAVIPILRAKHPDCTIEIFDVNKEFSDIFNNPEKYYFDKNKRAMSYLDSTEFMMKNGTSPSQGFIFWDDVHPTADVHVRLAWRFLEKYREIFDFSEPIANDKDMANDKIDHKRALTKKCRFFCHHDYPAHVDADVKRTRKKANDDFYLEPVSLRK